MEKELKSLEKHLENSCFDSPAQLKLLSDFEKAMSDESHPLWPLVRLIKSNQIENATAFIMEASVNIEDLPLPLDSSILNIRIAIVQEAIKYAESIYDDVSLLEKLPMRVVQWAGIGVGLRAAKAAAGRNKGKAHKEKIIEAWESASKKLSVPAFARRYFLDNGGSYDENGNSQGNVPSIRTIEKYIREHVKK